MDDGEKPALVGPLAATFGGLSLSPCPLKDGVGDPVCAMLSHGKRFQGWSCTPTVVKSSKRRVSDIIAGLPERWNATA